MLGARPTQRQSVRDVPAHTLASQRRKRRWRTGTAAAVAASIVLLIGAFILVSPGNSTPALAEVQAAAQQTADADTGRAETVFEVRGTDGTVTEQLAGKVATRFSGDDLDVSLDIDEGSDLLRRSGFDSLDPTYESDYAVYVDETVTNGVTYFYVVIPIDAAGQQGPSSNVAEATPSARRR